MNRLLRGVAALLLALLVVASLVDLHGPPGTREPGIAYAKGGGGSGHGGVSSGHSGRGSNSGPGSLNSGRDGSRRGEAGWREAEGEASRGLDSPQDQTEIRGRAAEGEAPRGADPR